MATNTPPDPVLWGIQYLERWGDGWTDWEPLGLIADDSDESAPAPPLLRFLSRDDAEAALRQVRQAGWERLAQAHAQYKERRASARRLQVRRLAALAKAGLGQQDGEQESPLRDLPARTPRLPRRDQYTRRWRVVSEDAMWQVVVHLDGCECDDCYFLSRSPDWLVELDVSTRLHVPHSGADYDTRCVEFTLTHDVPIESDMSVSDLLSQFPRCVDGALTFAESHLLDHERPPVQRI